MNFLARPQLNANTAWNESLYSSLRKRVGLVLPCWTLARTTSYRPFCTASAICCMLSIDAIFISFSSFQRRKKIKLHIVFYSRAFYVGCLDKTHKSKKVTKVSQYLGLPLKPRHRICQLICQLFDTVGFEEVVLQALPFDQLKNPLTFLDLRLSSLKWFFRTYLE